MTALWGLLWGLRKDGDIIWLLTQAVKALGQIAEPTSRRDAVGVFLREAEVRAKVRAFNEAMRKIPKL